MKKVLFLVLLASIVCVQCSKAQEAPAGTALLEGPDYCDLDGQYQFEFLQCIIQKVPALSAYVTKEQISLEKLLRQICKEGEEEQEDDPEELVNAMVDHWDDIVNCVPTEAVGVV